MRRIRALFSSITTRLVFSQILVAATTSIIGSLFIVLLLIIGMQNISSEQYRGTAIIGVTYWLLGLPDGKPMQPGPYTYADGFFLVASKEGEVLFTHGDTPCRASMQLAECAPDLLTVEPHESLADRDGQIWVESVIDVITGQRAYAYIGIPHAPELSLMIPNFEIYGTGKFTVIVAAAMAILAIPVALVLSWLTVRPLARRLANITKISKQFAEGDLSARVHDTTPDKAGELACQFDDMADTLQQNVSVLRDMAQRNAELAHQVEHVAIQAERVRLSRDLHDAIAQRLFSLSVSTSTLPDLIARDQSQGVQQAKAIATLAEQTLLDLRALLVELRPTSILQRGLNEALANLCNEWQLAHRVSVEYTAMLTGKHIATSTEDVIFRVTQEALNNIAKHTHANAVHVSLVEAPRKITLSVTDNGPGFDPDTATRAGKFGLLSMRERAQSLGGTLAIESDTDRGTTIRMTLPLNRDLEATSLPTSQPLTHNPLLGTLS
jgi:NarL family two-component system sensor histidine kinase LiaS